MIRLPPRSTLSSSSAASDVYKRQEHGDAVHQAGGDQQDEHRDQFGARVQALQEPAALRDVLAEHDLPQQAGAAGEGLLDERPLLALADAPAGTHRELIHISEPTRLLSISYA